MCIAVLIINLSLYPINDFDKKTIEVAKKRCEKIYPDAPCLKVFIKKDKMVYNAICGSKE